jgi:hypothetical protein
MNRFMKAAAGMLHILPCGNEGSFEHRICRMVKGGIADDAEKRFFFEDEGHLRRLNTGQVDVFAGRHGLVLKKQYYNYHYIGAIDWITQSSEAFILEFADPAKAIDRYAAQQLKKLRKKLLCVHKLRRVGSFSLKEKMNPRDFIKIPLLMPLYVFSRTFNICFRALVQSEWKRKKEDPRGSEMYLYYVRTGNYI